MISRCSVFIQRHLTVVSAGERDRGKSVSLISCLAAQTDIDSSLQQTELNPGSA